MAKDYITLGPVPYEEDCAQVGQANYSALSAIETRAYCQQLMRLFTVPDGVSIRTKSFPHEFGNYHEVCVVFDDSYQHQLDFACRVEDSLPAVWDQQARDYITTECEKQGLTHKPFVGVTQ